MTTTTTGADAPTITSTAEQAGDTSTTTADTTQAKSWRDDLPIHPAAELFPLMSRDDLIALGKDIKQRGLQTSIVLIEGSPKDQLIDGRNRLDAMEAVGIEITNKGGCLLREKVSLRYLDKRTDPYGFVISANLQRRHLTAEQRIEVAEKLAKADPTMSARRIAKLANISPTTAVKAKTKVQKTGDVSTVDTSISIDTKGRKQPARRAKTAITKNSPPIDKTPPADEQTPGAAGNDVDAELSAKARMLAYASDEAEAAATEITKPVPAENVPTKPSAKTKAASARVRKRKRKISGWVQAAINDLYQVMSAVVDEPYLVDHDSLEELLAKALEFVDLVQGARAKQASGGGQ